MVPTDGERRARNPYLTDVPLIPVPVQGVTVFAAGTPAPQGSKSYVGSKYFAKESSKGLPGWRSDVREALRGPDGKPRCRLTGPVSAGLDFVLRRPKTSKYGDHPAGKPDLDKLTRAVLDAATAAGVLEDDARVVRFHLLRKRWAALGELTGCWLTFRELTEGE